MTNEIPVKSDPEPTEMPKSPRYLAIMNSRKRRDRLSALLPLQIDEICQTQLSCLTNIDQVVRCEEISSATMMRINNLTKVERQIQVDTIKGRFDDLSQVRIDIADRVEKEPMRGVISAEAVLKALTDRDGNHISIQEPRH
jgi:hypothetical protein